MHVPGGKSAVGGTESEKGARTAGRMTGALIAALNHPVRREALRLLHQKGGELSATDMSRTIKKTSTAISHHLKVLAETGAAELVFEQRVRGATQRFYESKVDKHQRIQEILADTRRDDERVRR